MDGQRLRSGAAGEIATGTRRRRERRGHRGVDRARRSRGGWRAATRARSAARRSTATRVWLAFCALFLLGLVDWRRLLSIRNADLLVLLSFSVSLWFFNHGHVFAAMSLAYPPLAWVLLRCVWIARRDTPSRGAAGLARLAARRGDGVRRRLSHRSQRARVERDRRRLLGGHRRRPDRARPEPLRPLPASRIRSRSAARPTAKARCATASRRTAGARPRTRSATPTGRSPTSRTSRATRSSAGATSGTRCPAVHLTSILFDTICLIGLALVGRRFGGPPTRCGARVRVGRVAVLPVRLELEHERLDRARAARLGLPRPDEPGRARCRRSRSPAGRSSPRCSSAAVVRLPGGAPPAQRRASTLLGVRARRRCSSSSSLFLEPSPLHAVRVFYDRTVSFQIGRDSPFSLWDWRQYHAKGIPDLHLVQRVLAGAARRRLARARVVPAPPLAAPPRRADGRGARRLRARADALVLPLPPVVLPVRRARARRRRCPASRSRRLRWSRMTSRASRFSPFADRAAAAFAAAAVFLVAWGLVHTWFWAHGQLVDWPTYQPVRRRDARTASSRTATSRSSIRPARCPSSCCRRWLDGDYATSFAWLMAAVRRRARRRGRVAAAARRRSTSRSRRCSSAR